MEELRSLLDTPISGLDTSINPTPVTPTPRQGLPLQIEHSAQFLRDKLLVESERDFTDLPKLPKPPVRSRTALALESSSKARTMNPVTLRREEQVSEEILKKIPFKYLNTRNQIDVLISSRAEYSNQRKNLLDNIERVCAKESIQEDTRSRKSIKKYAKQSTIIAPRVKISKSEAPPAQEKRAEEGKKRTAKEGHEERRQHLSLNSKRIDQRGSKRQLQPRDTLSVTPRLSSSGRSSASRAQRKHISFEEHVWRLTPLLDHIAELEKKRESSKVRELLSASPQSGKSRLRNISTPVLQTVQAMVRVAQRRNSQKQPVTPPPQHNPYHFPELLAPIEAAPLSERQKEVIAQYNGMMTPREFEEKLETIVKAHNQLVQDERGNAIGLREELLNEDEPHMSTHLQISQASLRIKLDQISNTLDDSIKLLSKRLSPPPPLVSKPTKRIGLNRYMTSLSKTSSSKPVTISKKNTQISKDSEENLRGRKLSSLSTNRAFKSLQPVQTRPRKNTEQSPGGLNYSSVRSQDTLPSPRFSRKPTLQIPQMNRAPRSVKFNTDAEEEDLLDSPSPFITEADIYKLEALQEEAQDEYLSKRNSMYRRNEAEGKQRVNFKELQRRVAQERERELDKRHRIEIQATEKLISELEEELLIGMEDDGQEKRSLREVANTIAEAFEEKKQSEGEEMLLSTYSHEEIVNAFQMARRAAERHPGTPGKRQEKPQTQKEKAIQAEMKKFLEKDDFFKKIRIAANQKEKEKIEEEVKDEREQFVEACIKAKVVPLPMLGKLRNGVLALENYKLNRGLCEALGSTVLRTTRGIRKLVLHNNGITDGELRQILEGLRENRDLRNLSLAHNELGPKATELLIHLLTREEPLQLTELKIQKLKGSSHFLNRTLQAMAGKCKLKVLGLSEAGLNDHSVSLLEDFVAGNPRLESLDISFNRILPLTSLRLLHTLAAQAKTLRHIDFSWNTLRPPDESLASEIAIALAELVRGSQSLLHLNLSRTGLAPEQAFTLFRAVRKSKSLLSVHLSGNSIDQGTKAQLRSILESSRFRVYQDNIATKVRPRPKLVIYKSPSPPRRPSKAAVLVDSKGLARAVVQPRKEEEEDDELQTTLGFGEMERRMALPGKEEPAPHLSPLDESVVKGEQRKMNVLEKRELAKGKAQASASQLEKLIDKDDLLVYSRALGHPEIVKSRQWYQTNECWVCEQWCYMVVLWSPRISQRAYIQAQDIQKEQIFDKIEVANFYASINLENDPESAPRLAGSFTDWKERDMLPLSRFCEKLLMAQERQVFNLKALISRSEKKKLGLRQMAALDLKSRLTRQEIRTLRPQLASLSRHFWPQFFGELSRYPPLYAGLDLEMAIETVGSAPDEKLWVWAGFVPPGKHSYSVLFPNENKLEQDICFNQVIVQPRSYPLEVALKRTKIEAISRRFDRAKSVFRDWRIDTDGLIQRSVFIDLGLSKLSRFVRDPTELGRVEDVLLDFARPLKDLFTHSICRSDYPSISWLDFAKLCQSLRIVDRQLTLTAIDQAFIAVNVELEALENNPDRDLCRYEFYEILVRMARTKYLESKRQTSLATATRRFLRDEVLQNANIEPWQDFRDQLLWTLPVNDLLEANLEGIRSLFSSYLNSRQNYLTLPNVKTMLIKDARLRLNEKEVLFCFGYSKMTVIDEMKAKDQYDRLVFVEFLELLGRVADLNFRDTELQSEALDVKLALILEVLLPLVGHRRKDPLPPPPPDSHTDNDDEDEEEDQS